MPLKCLLWKAVNIGFSVQDPAKAVPTQRRKEIVNSMLDFLHISIVCKSVNMFFEDFLLVARSRPRPVDVVVVFEMAHS